MKVIRLFAAHCFFCTKPTHRSIKTDTVKYHFIKTSGGRKMNRKCFIEIALFLLISSLCLCISAVLLGSFYIPYRKDNIPTEASSPKYSTVIIDAGHGGEDGGASSRAGLVEKDVNLDIARHLAEMLSKNGINVIMTRDEDKLLYDRNTDYQGRKKKLDHAARLNIMQKTENAIFVSIHMNSYTNPKYSGLQVWYSQNYADSIQLAQRIQDKNKTMLQAQNERKIKAATSSIFLLDKATCPAVLVECGFLSNPDEAAKFKDAEYRRTVAFMLYRSISDFLRSVE